jgi:hypothetical protein
MTEYIKTAGDYRLALKDLPDDAPVEPFLNDVETKVYFAFSGEGDQMNLIVEPNYTCGGPPDPLPVLPEHKGP